MAIFKIVFIYLFIGNLRIMDLGMFSFYLYCLGSLHFLDLTFSSTLGNFGYNFFNYFSVLFSLYSPFGIQITYMSDIVPQVSEHLFIFLQSILPFLKLDIFFSD